MGAAARGKSTSYPNEKEEIAMAEPILISSNLRKSFGEIEAVRGVSLEVEKGEIFGLLGPNGAGKTTTISMLTGIIEADEGTISVGGKPMNPSARETKALIGLVPQELALYETLSARNNLLFFGRIYGLKGKELRRRVDDVLTLVNLADRADDVVSKYSGGMKRRINIAAGLLHRPQVLFLDEPTVGVDPQSRNAIFEGIEKLNRAGMTIIYTTHYMEEAERLCHRVAIVDEGSVVALDSPTGLIRGLGGGIIIIGFEGASNEGVAEAVSKLSGVKNIESREEKLYIETTDIQEALTGILGITGGRALSISHLEMLEPNLETVFLHLTGKTLRE
jgi:ABC-2 type transport system ATP-binding protein